MNNRIEELKQYMKECQTKAQQEIEALVADDRADEAKPYRASANIYDVFTALIDTSAKQAGGDEKKFVTMFHNLAAKVPSSWKQSLEAAKAHDDFEKVIIEEAKLQVADEIIAKFDSLFK